MEDMQEPELMNVREAINQLRGLHEKFMSEALTAETRLRLAEKENWSDSWKFEDDFHKAWYNAAGVFAAIKFLEQYT